jgi:hypothetical protein
MRARALLAALAVAALTVGPVAAEEPEEPEAPVIEEQRVYFHCNGDTKVANVHATLDSAIVGWSTEAPTASFTEGAGCGTVDTALTGSADHNPLYDAPFEGSFRGNLDSLTVHAHSLAPINANLADEFEVFVLLQVGGRTLVSRNTMVKADAIASATGLSSLFEFTVSDIGMVEPGVSTRSRQVQLTLMTRYLDDNNNWVFDTTEVDSGITFNPSEPAAVSLPSQG